MGGKNDRGVSPARPGGIRLQQCGQERHHGGGAVVAIPAPPRPQRLERKADHRGVEIMTGPPADVELEKRRMKNGNGKGYHHGGDGNVVGASYQHQHAAQQESSAHGAGRTPAGGVPGSSSPAPAGSPGGGPGMYYPQQFLPFQNLSFSSSSSSSTTAVVPRTPPAINAGGATWIRPPGGIMPGPGGPPPAGLPNSESASIHNHYYPPPTTPPTPAPYLGSEAPKHIKNLMRRQRYSDIHVPLLDRQRAIATAVTNLIKESQQAAALAANKHLTGGATSSSSSSSDEHETSDDENRADACAGTMIGDVEEEQDHRGRAPEESADIKSPKKNNKNKVDKKDNNYKSSSPPAKNSKSSCTGTTTLSAINSQKKRLSSSSAASTTTRTLPADRVAGLFPLFQTLSKGEQKSVAQEMQGRCYGRGKLVYSQGDEGDRLFLIIHGYAHVIVYDEIEARVGDEVKLRKPVHFMGKCYAENTLAVIDKHDSSREFPYTIRILHPDSGSSTTPCSSASSKSNKNTTSNKVGGATATCSSSSISIGGTSNGTKLESHFHPSGRANLGALSTTTQEGGKTPVVRGRVMAHEIELIGKPPSARFVATLVPGDYFGEQEVISGSRDRKETIVVGNEADLAVMTLSRMAYRSLGLPYKHAHAFPKKPRHAICLSNEGDQIGSGEGGQVGGSLSLTPMSSPRRGINGLVASSSSNKSEEAKKMIMKALHNSQPIRKMLHLTPQQRADIADQAYKQEFSVGDVVVSEPHNSVSSPAGNKTPADSIIIVDMGKYKVGVKQEKRVDYDHAENAVLGHTSLREREKQTRHLREHQTSGMFGEYSALFGVPPVFHVVCVAPGHCWVIPRKAIKSALLKSKKTAARRVLEALHDFKELVGLQHWEKIEIATNSHVLQLEQGQMIRTGGTTTSSTSTSTSREEQDGGSTLDHSGAAGGSFFAPCTAPDSGVVSLKGAADGAGGGAASASFDNAGAQINASSCSSSSSASSAEEIIEDAGSSAATSSCTCSTKRPTKRPKSKHQHEDYFYLLLVGEMEIQGDRLHPKKVARTERIRKHQEQLLGAVDVETNKAGTEVGADESETKKAGTDTTATGLPSKAENITTSGGLLEGDPEKVKMGEPTEPDTNVPDTGEQGQGATTSSTTLKNKTTALASSSPSLTPVGEHGPQHQGKADYTIGLARTATGCSTVVNNDPPVVRIRGNNTRMISLFGDKSYDEQGTPSDEERHTDEESSSTKRDTTQQGSLHWFGERSLLRGNGTSPETRRRSPSSSSQAQAPQSQAQAQPLQSLSSDRAVATVVSKHATVLAVPRATFDRVLRPHAELLLSQGVHRRSTKIEDIKEHLVLQDSNEYQGWQELPFDSLKRVCLLGSGGFGAVALYVHEPSGNTFALKSLSKAFIVRKRMTGAVMREKKILFMCKSRFIVRTFQTYRDKDYLHFLMEVCLGGELFSQYHRFKFHGSITKAKFYSATVITAFAYLHKKGIVYRDLKPENLLLDHYGFCKLTDMGLAKIIGVSGKTYTTCGTPDYFAPEVIRHEGQTLAVDWWCLGVLLYELMSGTAPFECGDPSETMTRIQKGVGKVDFSSFRRRSPDCVDLVCGLLQADPSNRLPCRPGGPLRNLRRHPWYQNFPWIEMWSGKVQAPFVPNVRNNVDIGNFRRVNDGKRHVNAGPSAPPEPADPGGWDRDF
ncbi:unnamed protein product [Amoebophrya sp. A25]|nr:unnamed protein product [Amoebophrya sp. A25]|eukprot:GSA25T00001602001.1